MKEFLASLVSDLWLIEETWLKAMIDSLSGGEGTLPSALDSLPSEKLPGAYSAKIYGSVASLSISGPIFPKPNFLTRYLGIGVSLEDVVREAKFLDKNEDIKTIIFDIDSPGGLVTGVNEASSIIKNLSTKTISYIGGTGASAAYWLASAADEIVLEATGRVGSIGVVAAMPNPQMEKQYTIEVVNSKSPNKRLDVSTKEGKEKLVSHLDDLAEVFIDTVAVNRNVTSDKVVSDFGKGGMLVGQKAVNAGMADRVGTFEELVFSENNKDDNEDKDKNLKGEDFMDLKTLQKDHSALYNEIVSSTKVAMETSITKAKEDHAVEMAKKDQEIADFQAKLAAKETENVNTTERIKVLEKNDLIRTEQQMKNDSENILDKKLKSSTLPDRISSKVRGLVDYNKFVKDNKFDSTAFGLAVDAEIKDFEEASKEALSVQGVGFHSEDTNDGADDKVVERMAKY